MYFFFPDFKKLFLKTLAHGFRRKEARCISFNRVLLSSMTSDGEDMMPMNGENSPLEDANDGGNVSLKKGPWTTAEDAILIEYVTKHGEGNWNAIQRHAGLARCGKSCRLRWANHLRPDLKKGAFTIEEENLIIELHTKMGNKWAKMAAEVCISSL